jgi:hypothetical protein
MAQKYLKFVLSVASMIVFVGCATKSVFPIEPDENRHHVFQYCGGQEWGYVKNLGTEKNSPSLAVYLESNILENSDAVALNFAVQAKSDLTFSSDSKAFRMWIDGKEVQLTASPFWIVRGEKQIDQRYPRGYSYKKIENSENEWEVRKQKYGGAFGDFALDEPFVVKISQYPNQEVKENPVKVAWDAENYDAIYILNKIIIPFQGNRPDTSLISVDIPSFELNGITVPASRYAFHYDREKLTQGMKDAARCASLDEIFREGRSKDSWIWWFYPRISD